MPIVSATDIPYGGFPTGRTSPQAPADYQQIPTDVSQFGALQGKALGEFGAGIEKLSTGVAHVAAYQQHVFDQTELTKMRMREDDAIYDASWGPADPTTGKKLGKGFLDLYGSEATNVGPPRKQLDDARDAIAASAPNDRVRQMFLQQSRAARQAADNRFAAHYAQQLQHANEDANKGKILQSQRDVTGDNSDAGIWGSLNKGREGAAGTQNPAANQEISDSGVVTSAIDAALAKNDPQRAKQILDDWGIGYKLLNGQQQNEQRNKIQPKLDDLAAEGDADAVLRRNGLPGIPGAAGRGGAAGAPAVRPYKAGEILVGTGASQATFDKYRGRMSQEESGGQYNLAPNKEGYMGKYQMNMKDIRESSARLGIPAPTQQEFLKDPDLQEKLFEAYEATGHEEMSSNQIYAKASPEQKLALLAAWHLTGGPNLNTYLATGKEFADSNGTKPSDYIKQFSQTLGIKPPLYGTITAGAAQVPQEPGPGAPTPAGAPSAAPPSPLMPLKTFEELEAELSTVDAAGNPISEAQQRKAVNFLRLQYNSHLASIRGEIANVKQLRQDDIASIEQTGQPIASVTPQRVAAAQGQAEADEHEEQRRFAQNYYAQTNDFDHLPTFDLNRRLEQMRQAGAGQPGFERFQKNFLKAEQKKNQIEDLRRTDPATAVARFPEVVAASQGADLANPQTYQPLVLARMKAMETIGLPSDAQIPITREEATIMWRPIGEALRNGNERLARQEMEKLTRSLEAGWGGEDTKALGFVLAAGHANERVHDMAAAALKTLAKSHEPTPAQLRAIDEARTGRGIAEAFGGIAPPPYPAPTPGETYLGQPVTGLPPGPPRPGQEGGFTPGGAYAPPTAGPPAPSYPVPTPSHITNLRQHPETANQFDAVYGHGAASRVFGVAPAMAAPAP